jgi:hypothetical protein
MKAARTLILLAAVSMSPASRAADVILQSGPDRVHLLELFTSEGCSSCPPAERWFSSLRKNPHLWKQFVPVAFHVDYWDNLGWKDPLASPSYSTRQRNYAAAWSHGSIYTPGFVLDGREWQQRDGNALSAPGPNVGVLTAILRDSGELLVTFQPGGTQARQFQATGALLGFDLKSVVKAGENSGQTLLHDFAVLAVETSAMTSQNGKRHATLHLPHPLSGQHSALAVWVTGEGNSEPVQAAGADLQNETH